MTFILEESYLVISQILSLNYGLFIKYELLQIVKRLVNHAVVPMASFIVMLILTVDSLVLQMLELFQSSLLSYGSYLLVSYLVEI